MQACISEILVALDSRSASATHAQFSSTVTLVSDYEFRGVSLVRRGSGAAGEPRLCFANGLRSARGRSNARLRRRLRRRLRARFLRRVTAARLSETVSWSAGLTAYTYPDSSASAARLEIEPYVEGYVDITAGSFHAAQWYTHDYSGLGVGALYTEVNYSHELPRGSEPGAHLGYSWGDYFGRRRRWAAASSPITRSGLPSTPGHFTLGGKLDRHGCGGRSQGHERTVHERCARHAVHRHHASLGSAIDGDRLTLVTSAPSITSTGHERSQQRARSRATSSSMSDPDGDRHPRPDAVFLHRPLFRVAARRCGDRGRRLRRATSGSWCSRSRRCSTWARSRWFRMRSARSSAIAPTWCSTSRCCCPAIVGVVRVLRRLSRRPGPTCGPIGADAATVQAGIDYLYWFAPGLGLQFAMVAMFATLRGTGIVKPTMILQMITRGREHHPRAHPDRGLGHGQAHGHRRARASRARSRSWSV